MTRLVDAERKRGLLVYGPVPVKLMIDIRNDADIDVYLGSTLLRSVRLDGFHDALGNLVACAQS